ncbi:MAG TPA: sulfite exporter TauE/SafE family protein [Candidatus Dormibacteraeota bacterium]
MDAGSTLDQKTLTIGRRSRSAEPPASKPNSRPKGHLATGVKRSPPRLREGSLRCGWLIAPLQRINGYKTVGAGVSNAASGVIFFFFASISWPHAVVLAVSSLVGGSLSAALGRRLPEAPLRAGIAIFGLLVAARLALNIRL